MAQQSSPQKTNPIVIKKYANRRLYNTDTSSYVTLDDLCAMIKKGEEIIVFDAKNGDDITRSVLTQIIVEQESKGQSLLPTSFLRQLIGFYGNNMQGLLPRYLEYTMQSFSKNQNQMQDYFRTAMGGMGGMLGLSAFEEMGKQNMAMFEQAMRMFAPFAAMGEGTTVCAPGGAQAASADAAAADAESEEGEGAAEPRAHLRPVPSAPAAADAPEEDDASIRQMQQRLDELQKQIASLSKKDGE